MASKQVNHEDRAVPTTADTDRETASGDLRPHPPIRQPARPVPMGARTEALHRAQKRRRTDARRATFITRSIWVLAHLLILAAILSAPSQIRKALLEETDPFQIALALVLIGMNALLYTWVSVSNPGIVNAESNAKRAARAAQQAAANTASTTAAQLASGNANRLDALYVPRASSVSSMGASSAISGTVGAKVNGFATPACVTTASPSTNTPTTWHTARMSAPDSSPAQPPSPMRLLSASPVPGTGGGYGRVPVTDDADDERFHDGLPSASAGLASTSTGQTRMGGKHIAPLAIPSLVPVAPGTWGAKTTAMEGLPWGMSEHGSVMSGAGDTSRMTATTCGDGCGTSSAVLADSPGGRSAGQCSPPASPAGTRPSLSPPTLLRGSAAETTASHFGFRRTLSQNPQRHLSHALPPTTSATSPKQPRSPRVCATNVPTTVTSNVQFRSASAGAVMSPAGPVAEGHVYVHRYTRELCNQSNSKAPLHSVNAQLKVPEASKRGVGVPVAEAHSHSQLTSVSGARSPSPRAATLVEMTTSLQRLALSQARFASRAVPTRVLTGALPDDGTPPSAVATGVPEILTGEDFDTSGLAQQNGTRSRIKTGRTSMQSVHSHTLESETSSVSEIDSRCASPTGFESFGGRLPTVVSPFAAGARSPSSLRPPSSLNVSVTVSGNARNGDLHSSSSAICGNGCINVRGTGPIAKSANSAVRVLHRSMHSVGRCLTMLAGFRFGSRAFDDEDALLELEELEEAHALHAMHVRHASSDSTGKPMHERKLSESAAGACFACVRPACVEEIPDAGPVGEGRFTRGQERNRVRAGTAQQQGQEHALDVFGTPLVRFGSKSSSDMMGGLVGVEMLSYEPTHATELNPFVDDHEMCAPRASITTMEHSAFSGARSGAHQNNPIGGAMPLAVTSNDPLAVDVAPATIDVSDDPLCSQGNPDTGGGGGASTPSAGRAARSVTSVLFSTSKNPAIPKASQGVAAAADCVSGGGSSPRNCSNRSPHAGVESTAGTAHAAAAATPGTLTLEPTVETVVVPDEDRSQLAAASRAHASVPCTTENEPMMIAIDNPLHVASADRRPSQSVNVAPASTSTAPSSFSALDQRPSPAQLAPPLSSSSPPHSQCSQRGQRSQGPVACGGHTERDTGAPLQGISSRRHMCVVPDPRATYRSHLRGSLGLSNMSLSLGAVAGNSTPAPDWYSPVNPGRDCPYCELWQPMRAKHCHDCGHCVRRFDHHCAWIGNCVGERNHRLFFSYLTAQLALLVWAAYQLVGAFGSASRWNVWVLHQLHLLLAMVVLILFSMFVASLWMYHMYLAFTNQTTYEASFRDRVPYLKDLPEHTLPFSTSLSGNLHQFCCPDPNAVYTIKLSRSWTKRITHVLATTAAGQVL